MPSTPQELITESRCAYCTIPPGTVWYTILAAVLQIANGMPLPTEPNALMNLTPGLRCIPEGTLPYAILVVLQQLSTTVSLTRLVTYGTVNPTVAPFGDSGIYYRTDTGDVFIWNPTTTTWDLIID